MNGNESQREHCRHETKVNKRHCIQLENYLLISLRETSAATSRYERLSTILLVPPSAARMATLMSVTKWSLLWLSSKIDILYSRSGRRVLNFDCHQTIEQQYSGWQLKGEAWFTVYGWTAPIEGLNVPSAAPVQRRFRLIEIDCP